MCKRININDLTLEFCKENPDKIDWSRINNSKTQLPYEFMRTFQHYINWNSLSCYQDIPIDLVKLYHNKLYWEQMVKRKQLPHNILILCPEHYWSYLYLYQMLSEKYLIALVIIDNLNETDWDNISKYQQLSPSFMRTYADKLNWKLLSQYQILPENLIEEFAYRVDWHDIMIFQTITEDFRETHKFSYCLNNLYLNWTIEDIKEYNKYSEQDDEYNDHFIIKKQLHEKYRIINKEKEDKQEQICCENAQKMYNIYNIRWWDKWRTRPKCCYSKYYSAIK